MAQKYTPLNLSFLQNQFSPNRDSIANTAAMIMANSGWSKPSQATMKEIAKAQREAKANSAHKQSFLSSVFDLLSTPLYGVANALDESLAGHQSDPNDSVLEDIGKTVGGVFTGLPKGLGAGLRGASGIVDALPGVDINDDWQADPTDKTHFSDVAIRKQLGMSSADAMKPENWEKIRPKLEAINAKSDWNKTIFELAIPNNLDYEDARKDYFRNQMIWGLPVDVAADPLNAVFLGAGTGRSAIKATKGITEGLEEARNAAGLNSAIETGMASRAQKGVPAFKAELDQASPIPAMGEIPTGTPIGVSSVGAGSKGDVKTLANLGRREAVRPAGTSITPRNQKGMAVQIAKWAGVGQKGWQYRAADYLNEIAPNVSWDRTMEFLESADRAVKARGGKHNADRMAPHLLARIQDDLAAVKPVEPEIVRETRNLGEGAIAGVKDGQIVKATEAAARMKRSDAQLANQVVRKFEKEILHTAKPAGTGEGLARAIAGGQNVRYSGPQQARMWNQVNARLLKIPPKYRYKKATEILRAVEDYFISKGAIPHSSAKTAESVPLRLSRVAEAIGPEVLARSHAFVTGILHGDPKALAQLTPEQVQALQKLRAEEALSVAPAVQKGMTAAKETAEAFKSAPLSVARKTEELNRSIRAIKEFTAAQGGGDVGSHVVGEYMGNILGKGDPVNSALHANRLKTEAWLGKMGRGEVGVINDPEFVRSVTNAIGRAAALPPPAQLGKLAGNAARVKDWLGARFNAAYGVQDMRPIFLRENASAMITTARRAKLLNDLGKRFSPKDADLWHEAFRAAQENGISSGRVAELQSEIAKTMENLFGGTGLRSGAIADSTVIGRNRLLLDELNTNLKRFGLGQHKFDAGRKVKMPDGTTRDFSKGLDWMKSWEAWNVKNPYEFLHRVQNAVEFTVREKNMFDDIASRFGSPAKKGNVKYAVNHPRLHKFFFTEEGARQAKVFIRMLEEVSTPNSKTLQYFDHVLSKLKASLTIYMPGHHMTNLIGSTYYNWIAGVNKPIRYEQAMKTMLAQKGRYGEFAEIGKPNVNSFGAMTGPDALNQAVARSMVKSDAGLEMPAKGNNVVIKMQNGTKVTADMIYAAAMREGILPSAKVMEEVGTDVTSVLDKWRPLGGRGQRAVHEISEIREHIPRLALFIDRIAKHRGGFDSAVRNGAASVRKWHPDGLDLTKFERDVMKRIFPFYSWTRKAIPLAIESAIFAGPKVMAYPRLMEAIALSNGIEPNQGTTDLFPNDQMFPDWLRDRGIGPILGGAGNYTVVNPSTPVLDVLPIIGHPGQSAIDMLNPMLKVPVEAGQGQTLGRNVPIGTSNEDWLNYFAKQIPVVSQAGRASGQFGVSDSTQAEGFPNWINILNMLTGAKAVQTGKYQKSAQFDLRDYMKMKQEQQGR